MTHARRPIYREGRTVGTLERTPDGPVLRITDRETAARLDRGETVQLTERRDPQYLVDEPPRYRCGRATTITHGDGSSAVVRCHRPAGHYGQHHFEPVDAECGCDLSAGPTARHLVDCLPHVVDVEPRRDPAHVRPVWPGCHAGKDGECTWEGCPQLRDDEPAATGRHCPRDLPERGE